MLDDLNIITPINPPAEIIRQVPEPFLFNGLCFTPKYRQIAGQPQIQYYFTELKNLRIHIQYDNLFIFNSWHKFFADNNYSDFYHSDIVHTAELIADILHLLNFHNAKITRLTFGCVIRHNPEEIYNRWLLYRAKQPKPMTAKNKIYGSCFELTDYTIKGYNKTFETKIHYRQEAENDLFRFEVETRARHLRQQKIYINTVGDLYNKNNLQLLAKDGLNKFRNIITQPKMDLNELTPQQIQKFAVLQLPEYREHLKKRHNKTYKRIFSEYKRLNSSANDNTGETIITAIKDKFFELIEN